MNETYQALTVPEIASIEKVKDFYSACPACSSPARSTTECTGVFVLHTCSDCTAVYGIATSASISGILKGAYHGSVPKSAYNHSRYWDLMEPSTDRPHGYMRTHGWFDSRNGLIFQWG